MKPVIFYGEGKTEYLEQDAEGTWESDWYNYDNRQWANAVTGYTNNEGNFVETGYWVWIPRFEYKITNSIINIKFIPLSQTEVDSDYSYIHPAFRNGSDSNFMNGEWSEEIPGFWVSKYQAGYQRNSVESAGETITTAIVNANNDVAGASVTYTDARECAMGEMSKGDKMTLPVFLPMTFTYNMISIGEAYDLSRELENNTSFYGLKNTNCDSHLIKNSEWGAVMYLSYSKYGKNALISRASITYEAGQNRYRLTGVGGSMGKTSTSGSANTSVMLGDNSNKSVVYKWWTTIGRGASTTGSLYGVFDMNGSHTMTAAYTSTGHANLEKYATSFARKLPDTTGYQRRGTKYVTVLPYESEESASDANYNLVVSLNTSTVGGYGYGDGIREVMKTVTNYGWQTTISADAGGMIYPRYRKRFHGSWRCLLIQ